MILSNILAGHAYASLLGLVFQTGFHNIVVSITISINISMVI